MVGLRNDVKHILAFHLHVVLTRVHDLDYQKKFHTRTWYTHRQSEEVQDILMLQDKCLFY